MYQLKQIGRFRSDEEEFRVELFDEYREAARGLDGFSHIQILWWFDKCDDSASRGTLIETSPYKKGPREIGVFATRSPQRPNPIALSCAQIAYIDEANGAIGLYYADADDGSPVLDIKPYTPSLDRIESPSVPGWCAHWPKCAEDSGDFDWGSEFNF